MTVVLSQSEYCRQKNILKANVCSHIIRTRLQYKSGDEAMQDAEKIELCDLLAKLGLNEDDSRQLILLTCELLHKKVSREE